MFSYIMLLEGNVRLASVAANGVNLAHYCCGVLRFSLVSIVHNNAPGMEWYASVVFLHVTRAHSSKLLYKAHENE